MNQDSSLPRIFIALPIMDELEALPLLLSNLKNQNYLPQEVVVCVNQPDSWWDNADKVQICLNNKAGIRLLGTENSLNMKVIDRSSRGLGWKGKKLGVGWARKSAMDEIARIAEPEDVIISLDADTTFGPEYLRSVAQNLYTHTSATGLTVPYYHHLTGMNDMLDRAMLRYEIYMRCYVLNLWRIGNPYSFTALGSAIAVPVWAYNAIGGITPQKSGEDFYFLQKLRKFGPLLFWNDERVFPGNRLSDRVFFGTGPALIKGINGDWGSYPIYSPAHFDEIAETCDLFGLLFEKDIPTPMSAFLETIFGSCFWLPLRKNAGNRDNFVKSCYQKVDALRMLQFLKWRNDQQPASAGDRLAETMRIIRKDYAPEGGFPASDHFSFESSPLTQMNEIRDFLVQQEEEYQRRHSSMFPKSRHK
jgi:glycosyltransferase involved in cell wall biosynthesis